jgi:hypothetical protein
LAASARASAAGAANTGRRYYQEEASKLGRIEIGEEMRRAQADFHQIINAASVDDLRRPSNGTRWTNRQLLFHMVLGYLIVRTLLPLVCALGRLGHNRRFAATLNVCRRPFHWINYLGFCGGGQFLTPRAMAALLDRTIDALRQNLAAEGLTLLLGCEPPDQAIAPPPARCCRKPIAICERPALCVHRKSTTGVV